MSRKENGKCYIKDCPKGAVATIYCQMHYRRVRLYGDPFFVLKKQRRQCESSKVEIVGDCALVELTGGKFAKIDIADIDKIAGLNWNCSSSTGYAYSAKAGTSMQQFLLGKAPDGMLIDHDNRDRLDNRRLNIKFKLWGDNNRNSERGDNSGVGFHKASGKWRAYGTDQGQHFHLGLFHTEQSAINCVIAWKLMCRKRADEPEKADE